MSGLKLVYRLHYGAFITYCDSKVFQVKLFAWMMSHVLALGLCLSTSRNIIRSITQPYEVIYSL